MMIYNCILSLAALVIRAVGKRKELRAWLRARSTKACAFVEGQQGLLKQIASEMAQETGEVYWFHAASFGEYNVIRPVIRRLRKNGRKIVLTFFSPSGYEAVTARNHRREEVDHVFYLPLDTARNARQFIQLVHPTKAVFAISEYWVNYLNELRKRGIPVFQVSMSVRAGSYLTQWYGYPIRRALRAMHTMMVLDEGSKQRLEEMGFTNVIVTGDPLFDNAIATAADDYSNALIARFAATADGLLVAGSISDRQDLSIVSSLANSHPDLKCIFVPHELSEAVLRVTEESVEGKALRCSQCDEKTNLDDVQVLIVDFMGQLARIYRYGRWAYVGGGFTPYLHSVIEPVVYGMPVAYGPQVERKPVAEKMADMGIGCVVTTPQEADAWLGRVRQSDTLQNIQQQAAAFTAKQAGATQCVADIISQTS